MDQMLGCLQVDQSTVAMVEHFGRFVRALDPGCYCVPWCCCYRTAGLMSLRINQLDVRCETKTKDNVFVTVVASIQYQAIREQVEDAFYRLADPQAQIRSYVFDGTRTELRFAFPCLPSFPTSIPPPRPLFPLLSGSCASCSLRAEQCSKEGARRRFFVRPPFFPSFSLRARLRKTCSSSSACALLYTHLPIFPPLHPPPSPLRFVPPLSFPPFPYSFVVRAVVRSSVPKMELDEVFISKNEIAQNVETELEKAMHDYGYRIVQTLIVDVEPDERVKVAMNEINAAQRIRQATQEKAEAEKILQVKKAEGDAEAKYLAGVGVARQRQAIVDGLRESVMGFSSQVPGTTAKDVLDMVMLTQYFDTMRDIGANNKSSTIFIPHGPGNVGDISAQI
ncbi:unnamed protein product, partial [Closterium sp. NIES-53]